MITQKNIERLEKIVSHYAMQDYKQANPKSEFRKDGTVIHHPYSLSDETNEAREILTLARKLVGADDPGGPQEDRVKAYLLRHKILFDL